MTEYGNPTFRSRSDYHTVHTMPNGVRERDSTSTRREDSQQNRSTLTHKTTRTKAQSTTRAQDPAPKNGKQNGG